MKDKLTKHWTSLPLDWRFFIVIVLIFGIFFRFVNLDKKIYWVDEVFTSLSLSGYKGSEVTQKVFKAQPIKVKDLQSYQYPNSEKGFIDTIKSLPENDVHPPFYFLIARLWVKFFGNSVAATRSFSAFLSLLVFPCLYWLCLELFESSEVGWIGITLVAVSPFHVLYAQEARMYSLWTVHILLTSTLLLRAMRFNTIFSWLAYSASFAVGLYTYLFSALVAVGHGFYVFIEERFRLSKKLIYYLASSLLAVLMLLPWIIVIVSDYQTSLGKMSWQDEVGLATILTSLFHNVSHIFMDFWFVYAYSPDSNFPKFSWGKYIKPLLWILTLYSVYFLCRRTKRTVWLFVLTLICTTPLILISRDVIIGSGSSTQARYLIPCYLGIQISIAYLFANTLNDFSINSWQIKLWRVIFILLISGGMLSCAISSQAETWSNKYGNTVYPIARVINQASNPLVISDGSLHKIIILSHQLNPEVQFLLVRDPQRLQIPTSFSDIFLYQPSQKLRKSLEEENYQIVPVQKIRGLQRIER